MRLVPLGAEQGFRGVEHVRTFARNAGIPPRRHVDASCKGRIVP
jgi:hypothetical protein